MGAAYAIANIIAYGGPLLLTVIVAVALRFALFRRKSWGWVAGFGIAVTASCGPSVTWQMKLRSDLAQLERDAVLPERLALEPGAVLHLNEENHAGITCGYRCPLKALPWVTGYAKGDARRAMAAAEDGSDLLAQADLWPILAAMGELDDTGPDGSDGPFPYRYLFLSASVYATQKVHDAVENSPDYWPADWPSNAKGIHSLFEIPPSGVIDFRTATPLYRRFNIQDDVRPPFFWGAALDSTQTPTVNEIVADLNARVATP